MMTKELIQLGLTKLKNTFVVAKKEDIDREIGEMLEAASDTATILSEATQDEGVTEELLTRIKEMAEEKDKKLQEDTYSNFAKKILIMLVMLGLTACKPEIKERYCSKKPFTIATEDYAKLGKEEKDKELARVLHWYRICSPTEYAKIKKMHIDIQQNKTK